MKTESEKISQKFYDQLGADGAIREAGDGDQEHLAMLFNSLATEQLDDIGITFDTKPILPEHADIILQLMRDKGAYLFVCVTGEDFAGFVMLSSPETCGGKRFSGLTIAVDNAYRRQGVGTALISHAQGWAASQGLDELRLTVRSHNTPAIQLYTKFNFEIYDKTETSIKMRWLSQGMGIRR